MNIRSVVGQGYKAVGKNSKAPVCAFSCGRYRAMDLILDCWEADADGGDDEDKEGLTDG